MLFSQSVAYASCIYPACNVESSAIVSMINVLLFFDCSIFHTVWTLNSALNMICQSPVDFPDGCVLVSGHLRFFCSYFHVNQN